MSTRARGVKYSLGTAVVGAVTVVLALLLAGGEFAVEVLAGAGVAVVVQVAVFWLFFVWALPDRQGIAYTLGMLVRLVAVGVMAFAGIAAYELAAAPTLFTMVACLFGSTILEALFLQRRSSSMRVEPGAATIR